MYRPVWDITLGLLADPATGRAVPLLMLEWLFGGRHNLQTERTRPGGPFTRALASLRTAAIANSGLQLDLDPSDLAC